MVKVNQIPELSELLPWLALLGVPNLKATQESAGARHPAGQCQGGNNSAADTSINSWKIRQDWQGHTYHFRQIPGQSNLSPENIQGRGKCYDRQMFPWWTKKIVPFNQYLRWCLKTLFLISLCLHNFQQRWLIWAYYLFSSWTANSAGRLKIKHRAQICKFWRKNPCCES